MKDKEELDWLPSDSEISLEREVNEEGAGFIYNHEFNKRMRELHTTYDLREVMTYESKDTAEPIIMGDVEAFRYGFTYPESEFRNFTKSTLTKILKNFVEFSSLADIPIAKSIVNNPTNIVFSYNELVHNTVMFLTQLFDLEGVRAQVKAYLMNPHTYKTRGLIPALEYLLTNEPRITESEKSVISKMLNFLQE